MAAVRRQQISAIELLKQVVQQRNWHQGKISHALASEAKRNLVKGKVSYDYACKLLTTIGYEKVEDEIWQCPDGGIALLATGQRPKAARKPESPIQGATTAAEDGGTGQ